MTALTNKQRVKANAALAIIHSSGGDASAVTAHAKQLRALGHPARKAYEIALTSAVATAPDLSASIERSLRLIEASDHATVALYDRALTSYNETGSEAELQALAPMMARDSATLAIRMGETTHEEIANGGLAAALGFDPGDDMIAAAMASPPAPAAPSASFAFKSDGGPSASGAPHSYMNGSQAGPFESKGYSSPKTGEALARQVGIPMAMVKTGDAPAAA